MKIKTMTASFGRLDRAVLKLEDGLNVICAQNEGGKSTWAGFLKTMLYGIDSRDRDKKGHLADKNRYQPWSGAPMEGEITLEWGGRDITIRRFRKGSSPFGGFSAVYTGTEEPVPGMTADNCGQLLTGVSREVFERSAFIGQNSVSINSTPDLEKRIAALVSSGEEDVSFSQANSRLKEWANRRRVNKTVGLIPKLEGALEQTNRTLHDLAEVTSAISQLEQERFGLEQARKELEGEQWAHRRLAQRALNRRFAQAQEEVDRAQAGVDALLREQARFGTLPPKDRLRHFQEEQQFLKQLDKEIRANEEELQQAEQDYIQANIAIQDEHFNSLTGNEARHRADEDIAAYRAHLSRGRRKKTGFRVCQILGLVLGGAIAAAGAAGLIPHTLAIPPYLPYAVGAGVYVVFALSSALFLRSARRCNTAAQNLLARYGVESPQQITALAEDYAARWQTAEDAAARSKQLHGTLNDRKARKENGRADLMDFVHSFAPEVKDLFGCSAALSLALTMDDRMAAAKDKLNLTCRRRDDLAAQGAQLMDTLEMIHPPQRTAEETEADLAAVLESLSLTEQALARARGTQLTMGDPAALAAHAQQLQQQLDRRSRELQAIDVAAQALQQANVRLQERFSPRLNQLAGEWMSRLTGGKYTALSLSRDLEASATQAGELLPRKSLALSKGTVDQLYLAVRLAVCRLCLPQEDPAPLVLDDALVTFDDERMALAVSCLAQLGKQQQVLLFTCQNREAAAAKGLGSVHTLSN